MTNEYGDDEYKEQTSSLLLEGGKPAYARLNAYRSADSIWNDWCGLRSMDPKRRTKSRIICSASCITFLTIFLPVLFLVIVPIFIQDIVNKSDIVIIQATIIEPNDKSFTSSVRQKFTNTGSITAKAHMHDIRILWEDDNDTEMVKLSNSNTIKVSSEEAVLTSRAIVTNKEELTAFNTYAMNAEYVHWHLVGKVQIQSFINVEVDIDKHIDLVAFNNFPIPPIVQQINTTGGTKTQLFNHIIATFTSTSNIELQLNQNLNFIVKSNDISIGYGTLPNCTLLIGTHDYVASMIMLAHSDFELNQINEVISNHTNGLDVMLTIGPFYTDKTIEWLAPALSTMSLPTTMPGITTQIIKQVDMYPPKVPVTVPFTILMHNPIDAPFRVTHITGDIFSSNIKIATVSQTLDITIPPHTMLMSPLLEANSVLSPSAYKVFENLELKGGGYIDVLSSMDGYIDKFPVILTYDQYNTTAIIHL
jgi:hypothetical protein